MEEETPSHNAQLPQGRQQQQRQHHHQQQHQELQRQCKEQSLPDKMATLSAIWESYAQLIRRKADRRSELKLQVRIALAKRLTTLYYFLIQSFDLMKDKTHLRSFKHLLYGLVSVTAPSYSQVRWCLI